MPRKRSSYRTPTHKELGVTREQYNSLFEKQRGRCAICLRHQTEFDKSLALDHCHRTGSIRGLLCTGCNVGIGYFEDNAERLLSAADYVRNV